MDYFLGVDIGTSAVKAVAFSAAGEVLHESSAGYPLLHPEADRSEQDPEEILRAVIQSVENILQHFHSSPPALIGFSAAMHSLMAVDEQGRPLSNLITWADNRAAGIASKLHEENLAEYFYRKTGVPVHAMSPFCKLLWLKENDPALFQKTFRFIGIKEYLFLRLFGIYAIDESLAAATGLMNMQTRQWDSGILGKMGLAVEKLSALVSVREIFRSPSGFPQLKETPFVIGGSDGAMANLGAASANDGSLVVSIGTSSAARVILRHPVTDPGMRSFCYYIKDDLYLIGGASNNGAVVLQWLKERFFISGEELSVFLEHASGIAPGSEGLIFLPYILGERAPVWNANARAVLFGLTIGHGRDQVIRAALEAVIRSVYSIGRPLLEKEHIRQIEVTGGFARNAEWVQLLADMFHLPVRVSGTVEIAAWGAVKLAMESLGRAPEEKDRAVNTFFPDKEKHRIYQHQFEQSEKLYAAVKEIF